MPALAVQCEADGVLGAIAPLALAASVGTALVVDLDLAGPNYPSSGSLARLVSEGPRRSDLVPPRAGVCVLRNGGVDFQAAREVVAALLHGWPHVVLRCRDRVAVCPTVPVVPLIPGRLIATTHHRAVYQQMGWREKAPGPGPVLPTPSRSTVRALCEGQLPFASRWIRSWRPVWGLPWA
jgi:hypothetical protein